MKQFGAVLALAFALLSPGCGSSEPAGKGAEPSTDDFAGYISENESTFHPEDFGVETWENDHERGDGIVPGGAADSTAPAEPDTVPGFRVQISITQEIDRANSLRDSLALLLPGEWVYMVYHPPYYKVRIGNFTGRADAGAMLEEVRRNGYPDAWIVPDKILRNPPPPPSQDTTDPVEPPPGQTRPPH